jgi:F-type H+-transporting ATPase subunit alpha
MTDPQTSSADPAAAWLARERARLGAVALGPQTESFGHVVHAADGIARISGLPEARLGELLRFGNGNGTGFVLTLDAETLDAVVLDEAAGIAAGDRVAATGEVMRVPVGEALLGRVVDPLGRALDAGGAITTAEAWPIERPAPAIIERDLVSEPVETGVLVVDALFALGRGQRELIIGDRATGKTALALDAIIAQKHSDMICVYVAVGQRATAVERAIEAVRAHGAPERCIFVVAPASAPAGLQWAAPFAGFTIAEWFRARGQHALVVIDDLTKHAATHRELALLTREPPGREAYPGDIFYLHARLLERAGKLAPELGGGSLTALPIAETDAGNLSAYIPTNLISITDGQIVLDSRLFAANQRPAVNVGLSVSRVGGKAQGTALRQVRAGCGWNMRSFWNWRCSPALAACRIRG